MENKNHYKFTDTYFLRTKEILEKDNNLVNTDEAYYQQMHGLFNLQYSNTARLTAIFTLGFTCKI